MVAGGEGRCPAGKEEEEEEAAVEEGWDCGRGGPPFTPPRGA